MVQELPRLEAVNAYQQYQTREGIPVYRGFYVPDVKTVELGEWARRGGKGAFINLEGTGGTVDAYICEIPPGGSLVPQRQMFEEMVFVLDGQGSTQVWYEESHKLTFEWQAGSLFAIPLNAFHRHFNGSGSRPARYLAVTNAPLIMTLFHNLDFIFNCPYIFADRFAGEREYFSRSGTAYRGRVWEANFVPDVRVFELFDYPERGGGGRFVQFELAHNTMAAHISEFNVGTYKKAHRHGPGAHVVILSGTGYSRLWPEGGEVRRVDWQPGSMVVPPLQWFHQHFNTGSTPARYLALRWGSRRYRTVSVLHDEERPQDVSVKQGGAQIEYEDEDPEVHREFERELAKRGVQCRMAGLSPHCTATAAS